MPIRKKKISELTLADTLKGLYTIGYKVVDGVSVSVKVGLEYIQTAYENVVAATKKALDAATAADTSRKNIEANEKERQSNETARVNVEVARKTAETGRVNAESSRVTVETARVSAEGIRITKETERQTKENARITEEGKRATAESGRVTEEGKRVTAESARVSVETARVNAESARVTEESKRVIEEGKRVTAENGRVTVESSRVTEEGKRKTAESGRASAETGRVNAESARVTEFSKIKTDAAAATKAATDAAGDVDEAKQAALDAAASVDAAKKLATEAAALANAKAATAETSAKSADAAASNANAKATLANTAAGSANVAAQAANSAATTIDSKIDSKIDGLVADAPDALDTLKELAAALGNDPNFATTMATEMAKKLAKTDVVNSLTNTAIDKPLSAAQGKVLNDTKLGKTETAASAANADKLDGYDHSDFIKQDGTNTGWYRSVGASGWYSQDYGGGIYMTDGTFVRTYNNKAMAAAGGFHKESDRRLKSNITPLKHTLEQILSIPTDSFVMNGKEQIGTIAQEIEKVCPEAVSESLVPKSEVPEHEDWEAVIEKDKEGNDQEYVKVKRVEYEMIGVLALEAAKLLKAEINELRNELNKLKGGISWER